MEKHKKWKTNLKMCNVKIVFEFFNLPNIESEYQTWAKRRKSIFLPFAFNFMKVHVQKMNGGGGRCMYIGYCQGMNLFREHFTSQMSDLQSTTLEKVDKGSFLFLAQFFSHIFIFSFSTRPKKLVAYSFSLQFLFLFSFFAFYFQIEFVIYIKV